MWLIYNQICCGYINYILESSCLQYFLQHWSDIAVTKSREGFNLCHINRCEWWTAHICCICCVNRLETRARPTVRRCHIFWVNRLKWEYWARPMHAYSCHTCRFNRGEHWARPTACSCCINRCEDWARPAVYVWYSFSAKLNLDMR